MPLIVSVLGSGWSVKGLDLRRLPGFVIGVNDSGILAPRVDAIVSMDRLWTEHRFNRMIDLQRIAWIRNSALANIRGEHWWLRPFFNSHKLTTPSEHFDVLNGTNSGMCALNLAYLMRPQVLCMFGFDHCRGPDGSPYWHKPYSWRPLGGTGDARYEEWSKQYEPLAKACENRGTKVFNASLVSKIEAFPRVKPTDVMEAFDEGSDAVSGLLRQPGNVDEAGRPHGQDPVERP